MRGATASSGKENEGSVRLVIPDGNSNNAEVTSEVRDFGLKLGECCNHTHAAITAFSGDITNNNYKCDTNITSSTMSGSRAQQHWTG